VNSERCRCAPAATLLAFRSQHALCLWANICAAALVVFRRRRGREHAALGPTNMAPKTAHSVAQRCGQCYHPGATAGVGQTRSELLSSTGRIYPSGGFSTPVQKV
jgi:hypothetical protein